MKKTQVRQSRFVQVGVSVFCVLLGFDSGRPAAAAEIADGFDYPIGSDGFYTAANDGDGWKCDRDFNDLHENGKHHLGEDWNAETGESTDMGLPVYSIGNGTVVEADDFGGAWGKVVIVRHLLPDGGEIESLYSHLDYIGVVVGESVDRIFPIGTIGDANGYYLDEAHLHFEIRLPTSSSWGEVGRGYSVTPRPVGWLDPSDFIDDHRPATPTSDRPLICKAVAAGTGVGLAEVQINVGGYQTSTMPFGWFPLPRSAIEGSILSAWRQGYQLFQRAFIPDVESQSSAAGFAPNALVSAEETNIATFVVEMESSLSNRPGSGSSRFQPGDLVEVFGTTVGLKGRYPDPCSGSSIVIQDGTRGTVEAGPEWCEGYERWKVRFEHLPTLGLWSAEGDLALGEYYLRKVAQPRELVSLSINGASSVAEGGDAQYACEAQFADGSVESVSPTWSENSSHTVISESGILSAGSVSADVSLTIAASFTLNGVTLVANKTVTILNSGGSSPQNVELIVNGGFESGTTGWTMMGPIAKLNGLYPRSGSNYAVLGETDNTADVMYQQFAIPNDATSATLSYFINIVSAESSFAEFDIVETSLRTSNGDELVLIERRSNLDKADGPGNPYYVKGSLNLMPWKGQTVRFHVLAQTDASVLTSFKLDDVSAVAVIPGGTQPTSPEIEVTGSGEVIQHGSTNTSIENNTDFGELIIGESRALFNFRISNRGDGVLNLAGNPQVRVVGSSSFTVGQSPSSDLIAAGEYVYFKIRFDPLTEGVHNATVHVESDASNISDYTFSIRGEGLLVDETAPVVTISSPTTGTSWSTNSNTLDLSGTASDNYQISQIVWSNDRDGGGIASGSTTWTAGSIPLKSGTNLITITALDTVGNSGIDTLTVVYTPTSPEISAVPTNLSQSIARGHDGADQIFAVGNLGSGTMGYSVEVTDGNEWLAVSPSSGIISGEGESITVSFQTSALAVGSHSGTVEVSSPVASNSPVSIPVTVNVSGVPPTTPWEGKWASGTGTAEVVATAPASDGGTLLVGSFAGSVVAGGQTLTSSGSKLDFFAVKLDSSQEVTWVKKYGGSAGESVSSCARHPDGGWLLSGEFNGTGSFGSKSAISSGGDDAFLLRLGEDGNVMWVRSGGGGQHDEGGYSAVDGAGNCYLAGQFSTSALFGGGAIALSAAGSSRDVYVAKYSADGDLLWAKSFGGSDHDDLYCASADGNGNFFLGGFFEGQATFGAHTLMVQGGSPDYDGFIAKLDPTGSVTWAKRFGSADGSISADYPEFVVAGQDGSCWFGGTHSGLVDLEGHMLPAASSKSAFVGKIGATGNLEWLRQGPTTTGYYTRATCGVVLGADNSLVFGGHYAGESTFGGSTLLQEGSTPDTQSVFFARIDASGTPLWAIPAYALDGGKLTSMHVGSGDRVRIAGRFYGMARLPGLDPIPVNGENHLIGEIGPPVIQFPPRVDDISDQTMEEDGAIVLLIGIGDDDTPIEDLLISATSSNTSLVPLSGLSWQEAGFERALAIAPSPNAHGSTTIAVSVSDGENTTSDSFTLTVDSVNDSPSKPANLLPLNAAGTLWTSPLLESSAFVDLDDDGHDASQWQILSDDGQVVVWDSGEDSINKINMLVADGVLEFGTNYIWRVRYKDTQGGWSVFSKGTTFKTVETFGSYQRQNFASPERSDPLVSSLMADPEHDGLVNLLEYAFGTNPWESDFGEINPSAAVENEYLTFTYIRRKDTADLVYVIELSDDLIHWDSQPGMFDEVSVTPVDEIRERVKIRESSPLSSQELRFIRLRVQQLQP